MDSIKTANTVRIYKDTPFDLKFLLDAARKNRLDKKMIGAIEKVFTAPEVAAVVAEINLTMPADFVATGLGVTLEWQLEGIGFQVSVISIIKPQLRVTSHTTDLSSGSDNKPYLPDGEEGVIDLLYLIDFYNRQIARKAAKKSATGSNS